MITITHQDEYRIVKLAHLADQAGRLVNYTCDLYNSLPHGHKDEAQIARVNVVARRRQQRRYWAFRRACK